MDKKTPHTITDIARQAGVSIATVSRILNGDSSLRIQAETRARVLDTAQALGYQPNFFAAALRTSRTGIIGALSPNLAGTFLPLLTQALQREARRRGVELLIGTPQVEEGAMAAQINKLQSLLFDGLLLLGDVLDYQATIRKLNVLRKPYVSVCAGEEVAPPLVKVDEAESVRMGLDYLLSLGHQRIAYLGSRHWKQEEMRVRYFREAAQARGLALPERYVVIMDEVEYRPDSPNFQAMWTSLPQAAAQNLLRQAEPPTAIVCANDGFALAALKGALQLGLRVPHDLSILGHNDEVASALFLPELTTIRQPLEDLAHVALEVLLGMIDDPQTGEVLAQQRHLLKPQLIIRGSCGPVP